MLTETDAYDTENKQLIPHNSIVRLFLIVMLLRYIQGSELPKIVWSREISKGRKEGILITTVDTSKESIQLSMAADAIGSMEFPLLPFGTFELSDGLCATCITCG